MNSLIVAWQDPESRSWYPVGKLSDTDRGYRFVYLAGAQATTRFKPFAGMQVLGSEYFSEELFPLFSNRIIPTNRPDYFELMSWLGIKEERIDPLLVLGWTGGQRETDSLQVFPIPNRTDMGLFEVRFFCHGTRHYLQENPKVLQGLRPGSTLELLPDPENEHDRFAVRVTNSKSGTPIGWVPRFISQDLFQLCELLGQDSLQGKVVKINRDAPAAYRVLCEVRTEWPEAFNPCRGADFEELANDGRDQQLAQG